MKQGSQLSIQRQCDLELVALIQEWLADESGHDEAVWPQLERDLELHLGVIRRVDPVRGQRDRTRSGTSRPPPLDANSA